MCFFLYFQDCILPDTRSIFNIFNQWNTRQSSSQRSCLTTSSSCQCLLFFDHLVTCERSWEATATAHPTWMRIHNFTSSRVLDWFRVIDCVPFSSGLGEQRQRWIGLGQGGGLLNRWWLKHPPTPPIHTHTHTNLPSPALVRWSLAVSLCQRLKSIHQ